MHHVLRVFSVFYLSLPMWECLACDHPVGSWVLLPIPLTQLLSAVRIRHTFHVYGHRRRWRKHIYSFRTEI